ncbi:hypothetical protein WQ54_27235 [Bacillus sp. SA1-12]|uniref:hypothetical protein n=1 Tax=Bacillus sp. SA1-12 TaxID=1455638 RepID=UPI000626F705|nr:hypothetical protein [Bacillus sp. SA1-12]KKI89254.1 hypothetical protein WQ54_27235 [Bacillus sp. SA1-12]
MVGYELTMHLQQIDNQLTKLMKSYQDYQSMNKQQVPTISFIRHFLNAAGITFIIIAVTYAISLFFENAKAFIPYIALGQSILAISIYIIFAVKLQEGQANRSELWHQSQTANSIYELDQQRFEILQELAASSIPQNYVTPTAIKRMSQLVKSGKCMTIDECLARLSQETGSQKHKEEVNLIQYLQTISYH